MKINTPITSIFETVNYEEISYCNTDEFSGGLVETEIYYCPIKYIDFLKTPGVYGGFEAAGKVTQRIICKPNYGFKKMKALLDTPEFHSGLDGSIGRKDSKTDFELQLLGVRAKLIGFSVRMRNIPMVFIVKDRNERFFIIGTLVSPAYISSFDLQSGKKYEDDAVGTLKLSTAASIYEYQNEIPVYVPPAEGDFDSDWHNDFD